MKSYKLAELCYTKVTENELEQDVYLIALFDEDSNVFKASQAVYETIKLIENSTDGLNYEEIREQTLRKLKKEPSDTNNHKDFEELFNFLITKKIVIENE